MSEIKYGFGAVFNEESRLLILGSFPSVKSREIKFYYGNKQNRFWRVVCSHFNLPIPKTTPEKIGFLLSHKIALWDIVTECEIDGSKDSTIKNFKVADIKTLLQNSKIRYIILNGGTAFEIFEKYYADIGIPYQRLSSTSPANTRFNEEEWHDAISRALGRA